MTSWLNKEKIREIIFGTDTQAGKNFDIILLVFILASVIVVMLESVKSIDLKYGKLFDLIELALNIFFTIEYVLRLYSASNRKKYATSFFGVIDLVTILPAFIGIFTGGTMSLTTVRSLRLLRVFRVFKMLGFMKEARTIAKSIKASMTKILVFLFFVLVMTFIFGSIMYLIEGDTPGSKFDNIPRSIYWAIVTLTTVGYGDISPTTAMGQFISSIVMILGYAVIAVPTGIVSADLINSKAKVEQRQQCHKCKHCGHDDDAYYCKTCGTELLS